MTFLAPAIAVLWLLVALAFVAARLDGRFASPPLPGWFHLAIAVLLLPALAGLRVAWILSRPRHAPPWLDHLVRFVPLVAATAYCLAVLAPGASPWAAFAFLVLLCGEEFAACAVLPWERAATDLPTGEKGHRDIRRAEDEALTTESAAAREPLSAVASVDLDDPTLERHFTRRREPRGEETEEGWLRIPISAGGRRATAHLGFCPPFAFTPRVEAEPVAGPAATVTIVQALPYGIRLEAKLDDPAPADTSVWIYVHSTSGGRESIADGGDEANETIARYRGNGSRVAPIESTKSLN